MTIRAGGRPRDDRSQATRYNGTAGSSGHIGCLRFLAFALVLGGVVLLGLFTVLRPLVVSAVVDIAESNPGALRLPFVESIVREDIGPALTQPASSDPAQVEFVVDQGDTATTLAPRLLAAGLITSERAFLFEAAADDLTPKLQAGTFMLRKNMTPLQVVQGLGENRVQVQTVTVTFREGLRIEQMTAKLQTVQSNVDPRQFYDLATNPPAELRADYPWLPKEAKTLEGFLYPATYSWRSDTGTAEELIRKMLDEFEAEVGEARMKVAKSRGLTFYQVMTLASIVEREAQLDEERPRIAGVYQNRLSRLRGVPPILNADPTIFYALDTMNLDALPSFDDWQRYSFWNPPGQPLGRIDLPASLAGFQTYQRQGLPPSPICSPTVKSIDAALDPDTKDGFLYFLAIPNGGGQHVFAKTQKQHDANRKKYGYL